MTKDVRIAPAKTGSRRVRLRLLTALLLLPASALGAPITFNDIAEGGGAGITYRRTRSHTDAAFDAIKLLPFYALPETVATPLKPRGAPGVVLFDADNDGDEDIYVTNGPGRANSLYKNQLAQGGGLNFIDVGEASGAGATTQDSTGACAGDIDNDGDEDLYVLGRMEHNRLFVNNGNGTFVDATASSGLSAGIFGHASCSMGDIDSDGLLDIAVTNTFDWARQEAIWTDLFNWNQKNQLFRNKGGNTFEDISASSGFTVLQPVVPSPDNATISWAVAMVDYDLDGDVDIMHGDDQAALPPIVFAGVNRGHIHIFKNDGAGHLANVTHLTGMHMEPAQWMGLSYGDLNCDGAMDMFGTSVGAYLIPNMGIAVPPLLSNSRWFFGNGDGTFTNPGQTEFGPPGAPFGATPFGWGTGMADYDNDGDTDIIYYGNLDVGPFITADNPGVVLQNQDCSGQFVFDIGATLSSAEKSLRSEVQGLALGDVNNDGFVDMVHVSSQMAPPALPLVPAIHPWGSPFDVSAYYVPTFTYIGPAEWEWSGVNVEDGYLGVQINSATSGNKWAKVTLKGSVGLASGAKTNRSAIGAVAFFTPNGGKQVMAPILGGSSYASRHSLTQVFGLGSAATGTLEILWTGGKRNRLYDVAAGERLAVPEVPCDFTAAWPSRKAFLMCVDKSLAELRSAGVVSGQFGQRLRSSASKAYDDVH